VSLVALGAVLVVVAMLGVNRLIRSGLAAPRVVETGVPAGLPWIEVGVPGPRGKRLFGWFIPAATAQGGAAPALAILHGWGGNAEVMLPLARPLHEAGYALLFFDARSHGRSDGDSFASLPRFAEDLEHAVRWLKARPEVDPQRVGVVGHSVGAGAALLVASRSPGLAAVVSLAAFAHPAEMMRRWLAWKGIPYRPLGAYILFYVQWVIGHRFDDIAPCNTIRQARCPVLLAHGTDDATVPTGDAERIYANRRDERVSLFLMPGSHDEYGELTQAMAAMTGFLNAATDAVSLLKNAPANGACSAALQDVIDIKKENSRMSQESTWSNRYRDAGEAYLFGTEPNRFLAHRVELLQSGRTALSVADGEGRNSVWLAEQGLDVTAIEISAVAIEKARRLALGRKVEVSFQLADMLAPGWPPAELHNAFDWVVGIFIQFVGPEWRDRQFDTMKQLTRPGGRILLQGYTVKQLEYRTGGPSAAENLYTDDILRDAFADWEIEELVEYEEDITEGTGHKGRSALIGLMARKPA